METILINNRNHPLFVRITPRLVMGNKHGPKLLGRHSNSRPNTPVARRQLVEDYRNRNLHSRRGLIYSAKIHPRILPATVNTPRNVLATINTIPCSPYDL